MDKNLDGKLTKGECTAGHRKLMAKSREKAPAGRFFPG
jgi:hypothetical protein